MDFRIDIYYLFKFEFIYLIKKINSSTIRSTFGIKDLNDREKKQLKDDTDYLEKNLNKI